MIEIPCKTIQDLLPLYCDGVCSQESKEIVAAHLAHCSQCKKELEKMQAQLPLSTEELEKNRHERSEIKALATFWSRLKMKALLKGAGLAVLVISLLFLSYQALFEWNLTVVPSEVIAISNVSQLADGRIAFHVRLTDGYDLRQVRFTVDEQGNKYMTPLRPVIKRKPVTETGLHNMYYAFDLPENNAYQRNFGNGQEIQALYFGTEEDHILVWEKGMELPRASEEIEILLKLNIRTTTSPDPSL